MHQLHSQQTIPLRHLPYLTDGASSSVAEIDMMVIRAKADCGPGKEQTQGLWAVRIRRSIPIMPIDVWPESHFQV
jgi:hypothetical protein